MQSGGQSRKKGARSAAAPVRAAIVGTGGMARYHARAVALVRGKMENVAVLLGSATPSAESLRWAHDGRYAYASLPERVAGGALPAIEIVDMREPDARGAILSPVSNWNLLDGRNKGWQRIQHSAHNLRE